MLFLMFTELRARYFLGWKSNENERRINGGAEVGTNIGIVAMVFYICEESEQAENWIENLCL